MYWIVLFYGEEWLRREWGGVRAVMGEGRRRLRWSPKYPIIIFIRYCVAVARGELSGRILKLVCVSLYLCLYVIQFFLNLRSTSGPLIFPHKDIYLLLKRMMCFLRTNLPTNVPLCIVILANSSHTAMHAQS